ncbi:unnamed protein product [Danaus chrysippus]|uniref:(African queen) hypothetical protein n=1 Tax=Danaus chrysippus TaxID=151541 RepID=A0A8J2RA34_9NEOP|nr:unnamed protein product [Danaus chrysippus]
MSLCNSYRLIVVSCVVLSLIDTHAAFTLRRPTHDTDARDLDQQESVLLEVKHKLNRPNDIRNDSQRNANVTGLSDDVDLTSSRLLTDMMTVTSSDRVISTEKPIQVNTDITTDATYIEKTTNENKVTQTVVESFEPTTLFLLTQSPALDTEKETTTFQDNVESLSSSSGTSSGTKSSNTLQEPRTLSVSEDTKPSWKKYTTIERTRSSTTTPSPSILGEETTTYTTLGTEVKTETKRLRNLFQNASDIASLEKLKIELLLTTQRQQLQASENKFSRLYSSAPPTTDQYINNPSGVSEEVPTTESNVSSDNRYTVESRRGGYLDYSAKSTADDVAVTTETSPLEAYKEKEAPYVKHEVENETDVPYEKTGFRMESQSQLNEDALKEELLKEDVLIDNEENAKRIRDDRLPNSSNIEINSNQDNSQNNSHIDDKLMVKPIDMNTEKNTILYPVSSNYKPLKKIEVKPPKVFIRDPDDNSWRNESLSSLGIVFKSKNSSKPFTQVLKNKTETELNKLNEKDEKNETPELRERLQKMAEIRKSKKKKTDSLGNVVYFDYEESVSGEKGKTSKEEIPTAVNETNTNLGSSEKSSDITTNSSSSSSTTTTTEKSIFDEFIPPSTKKPKKFFNVEYYDNTEDDDTDYLNMAKIDIKKYTTTKMSTTMSKIRDWSRPTVFHKPTPVTSPERKGTVQYFPPLTTQKVNINDYDTDFKSKVNSFTTESEPPKNVIPMSTPLPTKTVHGTTIQYNEYKNQGREFTPVPQQNLDKNLYLTRPPLTTELFTLPGDGRDGYVVKHYRDFINQAAKDEEYDKNIDYAFVTQAPIQGVTKTDLNTYQKDKSRLNTGDDYDYETHFRKDVLQRFVDNFNRNSHRFKSDFPILFNNSVIHSNANQGGEVASSRAFMRGLYENRLRSRARGCEPHCDVTVELSPAYELHYYVPEQEERQEAGSYRHKYVWNTSAAVDRRVALRLHAETAPGPSEPSYTAFNNKRRKNIGSDTHRDERVADELETNSAPRCDRYGVSRWSRVTSHTSHVAPPRRIGTESTNGTRNSVHSLINAKRSHTTSEETEPRPA